MHSQLPFLVKSKGNWEDHSITQIVSVLDLITWFDGCVNSNDEQNSAPHRIFVDNSLQLAKGLVKREVEDF